MNMTCVPVSTNQKVRDNSASRSVCFVVVGFLLRADHIW